MPGVAESLTLYFAVMFGTMALALPLEPATLLAAKIAAPWLVATVASLAAVALAVADHAFVRRAFQTRVLDELRKKPIFERAQRWARVAPFLTTAAFAGLPLPFIVVRVLVPVSGYPVARYAPAVALGRFPRFFVIATFGTAWSEYLPNELLVGLMLASVAVAASSALVHRHRSRAARAATVAAAPSPGQPQAEPATLAGPREP
jgi:uncharacterized membrane protein YdjX (TVP38/TMEM64 family)